MRARIECVIFDFGGVLSLPREERRVAAMAGLRGLDLDSFKALYAESRADLDRGSIDRDRYWSRILAAGSGAAAAPTSAPETGSPPPAEAPSGPDPALLARLGREDSEAWTRINPAVLAWAAELRASGIVTAILSNMPRYILNFMATDDRFRWLSGFTPTIFSCEVGLIKPASEIYTLCLERTASTAGRCLFLDDHLANVDAARKAGIHAILFSSAPEAAREISRTTRLPVGALSRTAV